MLGDQRQQMLGCHAGLLHVDGNLRPVRVERAVQRDGAGLQHRHPHLPRLQRRWGVRRLDAGLSVFRCLRSVFGDKFQCLHGHHALLLHGQRHLRALPRQCRLLGNDADLQHDHARLRGLLQRRAVSLRDARLSVLRFVRSVLGHQHQQVHGGHAGLRHGKRYLRSLHLQRPVQRNHAGVQHVNARLPRLRR